MLWLFLLRWFHFLAGITWIGLLYYFNFVQVPVLRGAEAPVRDRHDHRRARQPRALVVPLGRDDHVHHRLALSPATRSASSASCRSSATSYGWAIFIGGIIGSLMWFNVWFIIWPAQQIGDGVGGTGVRRAVRPIPEAAAPAARGGRRVAHEHHAVDPDAVLHGRREPLGLLHADGADGEGHVMLIVFLIFLAIVEGNAVVGPATPDKASAGKKLPEHRQGNALGGLRAHRGPGRPAEAHLQRLIVC